MPRFRAALLPLLLALASTPSLGATAYENQGMKLDYSLEIGAGVFKVSNAQFGGGQDSNPATKGDRSPDWSELYMLPKLFGVMALEEGATLYGEFSMVAASTSGDGDAAGYTSGTPSDFRTESLLLGWKSGRSLPDYGGDALEVYAGRGRLVIGDGFLVGDGTFDRGEMACYWLGPHSNFRRIFAVRTATRPLRGDFFYLSTDGTQFNTSGYGFNADYDFPGAGTAGAMFLKLSDSDLPSRDGMRVFELRYMGNPLPGRLEESYLNVELAFESNGSAAGANALVLEVGHTIPWQETTLSARYSNYSGDKPSTAKNEGFDRLFQKGFTRGWGTWLEGEIVGEYYRNNLSNGDRRTLMLALKTKPVRTVSAGAILYSFDAARSGRHIADELDLFFDWSVGANLVISGAYAHAVPGSEPKSKGLDRRADLFELATIIAF